MITLYSVRIVKAISKILITLGKRYEGEQEEMLHTYVELKNNQMHKIKHQYSLCFHSDGNKGSVVMPPFRDHRSDD